MGLPGCIGSDSIWRAVSTFLALLLWRLDFTSSQKNYSIGRTATTNGVGIPWDTVPARMAKVWSQRTLENHRQARSIGLPRTSQTSTGPRQVLVVETAWSSTFAGGACSFESRPADFRRGSCSATNRPRVFLPPMLSCACVARPLCWPRVLEIRICLLFPNTAEHPLPQAEAICDGSRTATPTLVITLLQEL